ncbi:tRNA (adenosine(37)-N6)-threonylcarbamoyltransferase complex dimerization subunit type 1 TsaB [Botrimarina mediterranea]|uniref:tRNA (adenosine(37)-N6)-threonylcarbamoyltransferase complex dimerization subunit type 1 TsaB n=1 Tax=Botrimarina mediterranea TaxID=2528022 RepID=UPI00118D3B9C|nr:tRNA threonylcarbamoyladenosine biosynthesis protein TsaB [Planctomycetes bacterium K2D]
MMSQPTPSDQLSTATPAESGRWLAIETSGLFGSVAAGVVTDAGCELAAARPLPRDARSARTLAPAIQSLLSELGWAPSELAAVAIAVGPGSFTGLRVGVTTAKTLAWAAGAAAIGVDTLDALAEATGPPQEPTGRLWTLLDAQRGEMFVADFDAVEGAWERHRGTWRATTETLKAELCPRDRVVGPAAAAFGGEPIEPTAGAVLQVAWRRWRDGAADSVFALAPQYHRLSAAEEKLVIK